MSSTPNYFFLDGQKLVATDNGDGTKTLVVSGGGGGGGGLADLLYIDDTGTVFVYRDVGSGVLAAINVPAGTAYTVGANPRPWSPPTMATSTLQTAGNTSLSNLDTDVGAPADAVATTDTGTFSIIAFIKRAMQNWTTLLSRIPALVSGRVPVDGSSVTQPISATALPLPTSAATSALQTTGNTSLSSIDTKTPALVSGKVPVTDPTVLPLPTGAATGALQTDGNNTLNIISVNSKNLVDYFNDVTGILTTTTTSASFRPSSGQAYSVNVAVTAFTGTNPTLDLTIQESDDGGNNWINIWTLPRITATGNFRTPTIPYRGTLIRYVQTVGGTGVSCTRSINRLEMNSYMSSSPSQLFDRAIDLTTLGATSAVLNTQNSKYIQVILAQTGGTVAPVLTLQCSEDNGVTWYQTTNLVTGDLTRGIAQTSVAQARNQQLARLIVTTAGVGVTTNYVLIKGF